MAGPGCWEGSFPRISVTTAAGVAREGSFPRISVATAAGVARVGSFPRISVTTAARIIGLGWVGCAHERPNGRFRAQASTRPQRNG